MFREFGSSWLCVYSPSSSSFCCADPTLKRELLVFVGVNDAEIHQVFTQASLFHWCRSVATSQPPAGSKVFIGPHRKRTQPKALSAPETHQPVNLFQRFCRLENESQPADRRCGFIKWSAVPEKLHTTQPTASKAPKTASRPAAVSISGHKVRHGDFMRRFSLILQGSESDCFRDGRLLASLGSSRPCQKSSTETTWRCRCVSSRCLSLCWPSQLKRTISLCEKLACAGPRAADLGSRCAGCILGDLAALAAFWVPSFTWHRFENTR